MNSLAFSSFFRGSPLAWVLGLLILATGCDRLGAPSNPDATIGNSLARAKKLYEQRDYSGAIEAYEEILRIRPRDSNACFQIAIIYDRNLNDFLNACFYYQRYLQSSNPESERVEFVKGALDNAKLQFAALSPGAPGQNSPELVKLRTENAALHRQVEDLKKELVSIRSKSPPQTVAARPIAPSSTGSVKSRTSHPVPPPSSSNSTTAKASPHPAKTSSNPKNYTVRKGEGIQAIAEKIYHDRRRWRDILQLNPDIKDPNQLKPGQVLMLPP